MRGINFIFRKRRIFGALVIKINQRHRAAPEFQLQDGLAAEDADFIVPFAERSGAGAGERHQCAVFQRKGKRVVNVIRRTVPVETGKHLRRAQAGQKGQIGRRMGNLAVDLPAAGNGGVVV